MTIQKCSEEMACRPVPVSPDGFNPSCKLPFGLKTDHIRKAMEEYIDFLGFINGQLYQRKMKRFEAFLMPANFSSMVGEFMHIGIEKHCPTLVKNKYHNGHPDLIEANKHPKDAIQHHTDGIEIKASRYEKGWQGHNEEACWLMVFTYESGRPNDEEKGIEPIPFRFLGVYGAQLEMQDWKFSGRSETSRRTITASVKPSGYQKMTRNWIYRHPDGSLV